MIYEPLKIGIIIYSFLVLCISSYVDIKTKHIPNWITLPTIVVGLGTSFIMNWQTGLVILGLLILIMFLSFFRKFGGMGDVKLFMGLIALTHWNFLPSLFISIAAFILFSIIRYPNHTFMSLSKACFKIPLTNSLAMRFATIAAKFKIDNIETRSLPCAPFICFGYIIFFSWQVIISCLGV